MKNNKIITISRQFGSGGRQVGEMLAKTLDIPFYDNELITIAAKESGYSEELFQKAEEQETNSMFLSYSIYGSATGINGMPLGDEIFLIQFEVIRKLADKGPCVIVGRCADYVLKDRADCVNVFIHSNIRDRIERATKKYDFQAKKAEKTILNIDKKRASYYNYYTDKKWGLAENYDLSLASDRLGTDGCVDLIVDFISRMG